MEAQPDSSRRAIPTDVRRSRQADRASRSQDRYASRTSRDERLRTSLSQTMTIWILLIFNRQSKRALSEMAELFYIFFTCIQDISVLELI